MNAPEHLLRFGLVRGALRLDVDLALPARGITAIWGASGAGKTSLLRCVAGLERPTQALIRMAGQTWQDDAQGLFVPTWQRPLGYVFQEASLLPHLNVQGNLAYGQRRAASPAAAAQALEEAIALLDIAALLPRTVQKLSGGERQRVAIARALATAPRLLLLDEPLAALDAQRRREVLPWLEKLRDQLQIPMLYVTHSADEVAKLADTVVLLDAGRVSAWGPVAEVLAGPRASAVDGDDAVGALVQAQISQTDARWGLAQARFAGGSLWLRDSGLALGHAVRLRVLARDVSVAHTAPLDSSIQNLLPCVLLSISAEAHPAQVLLRLQCGESVLLARVTARAANALALAPGQSLWAQVKSVALVE